MSIILVQKNDTRQHYFIELKNVATNETNTIKNVDPIEDQRFLLC